MLSVSNTTYPVYVRTAAIVLIALLANAWFETALGHDVRIAGPAPGSTRGATVNALEDGRIVVFGGGQAKIWNPGTRLWDDDRSVRQQPRRYLHTATQATDGRIVMVGGLDTDASSRRQENALGSTTIWNPGGNVWEAGPSLLTPRVAHAAVSLPSNEVLVTGGSSSAYEGRAFAPFLASVELIGDKTTTPRAPMAVPRAYHTASLLQNGRVMVTGGMDSDGKPLASVEVFDPRQNKWVDGPPLKIARSGHTASVLPDGSILVVGGTDAAGNTIALAERWLASTNTWSFAGELTEARAQHQTTVLSTGDVLISGGMRSMSGTQSDVPALSLELWRAEQSKWTAAGLMPLTLRDHLAVRGANDVVFLFGTDNYGSASLAWLPQEPENISVEESAGASLTQLSDGRFLLAGGHRRQDATAAALVYDPDSNRWTSTNPMHWARSNHREVLLHDGRVLVVGGFIDEHTRQNDRNQDKPTYPAEIWDPATGNWSLVATVNNVSGQIAEPALLPNGQVLLGYADNSNPYSDAAFIFRVWNPEDDSLTPLTKVSRTRPGGQVFYFPDGHLLYAGGDDRSQFRSSESSSGGKHLDSWEPITQSWRELPSADVSLTGMQGYPLQDGGIFTWRPPSNRQGATDRDLPRSDSALVWQPVWGWRTLPLPPGLSKETFLQPMALPKGELLLRVSGTQTWLWSPDSPKWLPIAHDVTWSSTHGMYQAANGGVIAFRTSYSSDSGFPLLEAVKLNRQALRWETVGDGYIASHHPAVVALQDGRVMVAGGETAITQVWQPKESVWRLAGYTTVMLRAPQGLLLEDGRVMLVGSLNNDETLVACQLWQPLEDRWESCGQLQSDAGESRRTMVLRYLDGDQVLWVHGLQHAMVWQPNGGWIATKLVVPKDARIPVPDVNGTPFLNPIASVWNPARNRWDDAADALLFNVLGLSGYRDAAGVVTALQGGSGQILQWDANTKTLTTTSLQSSVRDPHLDSIVPTADGCFVAWSNQPDSHYTRIPKALLGNLQTRTWTESARALRLPVDGRAAVASDGTVLIAGDSRTAFGRDSADLRLHASCSAIESPDPAAPLYLPARDVPEVAAPAQAARQHIPLAPKPQLGLGEQLRAEWVAHWRGLQEHIRLNVLLGVLIVSLALRFFVNWIGAYGSDEETRSAAVKIDIAIISAALPVLLVVLSIPISLVQGIAGIAVAIVGLVSARRLWDHSENVRDKVVFGASYAATGVAAVLVSGTYVGEQLTGLLKFLTDYS